ncbi:glycosyltransferase [Orrella marina]|uniref:Glycosyl transferase n=1 Tax=Orrella marina TaxID=2163011 RepID=A0A2R4XMH9_9BURK|nr:glycosyltransferase [Orrella marina]AWB35012.1 glycosyl transferase [Orrella marina]
MKVLHVYRTFFPDPPGGLQEAIRQICISGQRFGHESRVFTLSPNPDPNHIERSGIHILRSRSWISPVSCDIGGPDAFMLFRKLAKWADILHFHFPWPLLDFLNITLEKSKPRLMTYHSDIVRQKFIAKIYAPLMWRTLRSMDRIVATSPNYVETSPVLSCKQLQGRVSVIPLGIDENHYLTGSADEIDNDKCTDSFQTPYILFIGALRYYKGLDILLHAATAFHGDLVIAGTGSEHDFLCTLKQNLNLKNVHLIGQVSEAKKIRLLKGCSALVLPSQLRSEAFGMSMVEASIFSKPLISCEIGSGTSFVNKHNESGLVVPAASARDLANAMNQIFHDQVLAERLGTGARARYERLFSGSILGASYSRVYGEILAR